MSVGQDPVGTSTAVRRIQMPEGPPIWARIEVADESEFRDVGRLDKARAWLVEGFPETVRGVVDSVRSALRDNHPHEVTVSFGIEFSGQTGALLSVLAEASGKAAICVELTWKYPDQAGGSARPAP